MPYNNWNVKLTFLIAALIGLAFGDPITSNNDQSDPFSVIQQELDTNPFVFLKIHDTRATTDADQCK